METGTNTSNDSWWEYNVSEQFPVKSVPKSNEHVEIEVGDPHNGCIISTTIKNSKLNGQSTIMSNKGVVMAFLTFVDGIATGPCTLFEDGFLFFKGFFVNGYRNGRGQEYDENGNIIFDGYYSKGKRLNVVKVNKMGKNYWKEIDENGNIIRICEKDDLGDYNGISYLYQSEQITRVSKWKKGREVEVLKEFSGNCMIEYYNGYKVYEGEFLNSFELDYPRNGVGEELKKGGKKRIFYGNYKNGKRHGMGVIYKNGIAKRKQKWIMGYTVFEIFGIYFLIIIIATLLLVFSFIIHPILCMIILIISLILLLLDWKCHINKENSKFSIFDLRNASEILQNNLLRSSNEKSTCFALLRLFF